MGATELLHELRARGISVSLDGSELILRPGSRLPPDLLKEIRQRKAEIMSLVCQKKARVGDGQLPPLDRPPANETELRRLIDYLDDSVAFALWFEALMRQADPAEKES